MARHKGRSRSSASCSGENARRLYGIEPVMGGHERVEQYEPASCLVA